MKKKEESQSLKKPCEKEYKKWLDSKCNGEESIKWRNDNYGRYYQTLIDSAKSQLLKKGVWKELTDKWQTINSNYFSKTDYPLFEKGEAPEIKTKPYKSFINKTFRKNILNNDNYPEPPEKYGLWLLPDDWLEKINDLLRTTIIVKYLDGVEFLKNELETICINNQSKYNCDYEAKDHGYYAVHFYIHETFKVFDQDFNEKDVNITFEIQITTQIKDIIRKMTHSFYEKKRSELTKQAKKWQ